MNTRTLRPKALLLAAITLALAVPAGADPVPGVPAPGVPAPGVSAPGVSAPGAAMPPPAPLALPVTPAVVNPANYTLMPADELSITVVNFPQLNADVIVPPDGTVSVPLLQPVSVVGKTPNQVAQILTRQWKTYVVNPAVTVALKVKHPQNVQFYGFVTRPGLATYTDGLRLLEGLAEVGGALPTGDLSAVTVTHKTGQVEKLNLSHPETKGGTGSDIFLREDDNVYVPEYRGQVSVTGEVKTPGSYAYKDGMTVLDALTQVGNVNPDTADLNNSTLTRNGIISKIDLDALLKRADQKANVTLQAGDIINVPLNYNHTYVFGDVAKPGQFIFKPGDRLIDAFNNAGLNSDAKVREVNVIHQTRNTNTASMEVVDMSKFLWHGDIAGNPILQPGDVIYIPKNSEHVTVANVLSGAIGLHAINQTTGVINGGH